MSKKQPISYSLRLTPALGDKVQRLADVLGTSRNLAICLIIDDADLPKVVQGMKDKLTGETK